MMLREAWQVLSVVALSLAGCWLTMCVCRVNRQEAVQRKTGALAMPWDAYVVFGADSGAGPEEALQQKNGFDRARFDVADTQTQGKHRLQLLFVCGLMLCAVLGASLLWPSLYDGGNETMLDQQVVDAALDRLGVTRWAEAIGWLQMQERRSLAEDGQAVMLAQADTPVWVGRRSSEGGKFHSVPLCGGMKGPVEETYAGVLAAGYVPCDVCWEVISVSSSVSAPPSPLVEPVASTANEKVRYATREITRFAVEW